MTQHRRLERILYEGSSRSGWPVDVSGQGQGGGLALICYASNVGVTIP